MRRRPILIVTLSLSAIWVLDASAASNRAFVDVAESSGLSFVGSYGAEITGLNDKEAILRRINGNGVAVGDVDGDGDLDVYLLSALGVPNRLFRNELSAGSKTFVDVTAPPLDDLGMSRIAQFVDLDGDGDLDLVLVNDEYSSLETPIPSTSKLFRNEGDGTFVDVTAGSGFSTPGYLRCGLAVADYDGDGKLDLFVTDWAYYGVAGPSHYPGSNRLFHNLGGMRFEATTSVAGLPKSQSDSYAPIMADFDEDGDPDLYIAVDNAADQFYRNDDGHFVDVAAQVGAIHGGNDMGVACADFDGDGDLDMYTTNITDPSGVFGFDQGNVLYVNKLRETGALSFVDEAAPRGVLDTYFGWGTDWIDVDNDGDLDLVAATGFDEFVEYVVGRDSPVYATPTVLFVNDGAGNFVRDSQAGLELGDDSRALAVFDYDRDGDQDILITNVGQPVRLYENVAAGGQWLEVALAPDAKAIGATVTARVGGRYLRRDVITGTSYLTGKPSEVHFGLGSAAVVDTLRVRWADGRIDVMTGVPADQVLRLEYGANYVVPSVTGFRARWNGPGVDLSWEVMPGHLDSGFDVYRGESACARQSLTDHSMTGGSAYTFTDAGVTSMRSAYWLLETTPGGDTVWHGPVFPEGEPASAARLFVCRPNPFRAGTEIPFFLPDGESAELTVLDVRGRRIRSLAGGPMGAGIHRIFWEGNDDAGIRVPAGTYFLDLRTGSRALVVKTVRLP